MIGAGDHGHVAVRVVASLPDDLKRVAQVLFGGGCLRLHEDALLRQPVLHEPVMHGLSLRDVLAFAHAAGDDGDGIGILVQIIQGSFETPHQCKRGTFAVDGGAEHNEIRPLRLRIGAGIFDDRDLNNAEIDDAEAGQAEHDPPEKQGKKPLGEDQRDQEEAEIAPVDVAAQRKAEETAQRREHRADDDPDRVFFLLSRSLLRFHHSEPPNVRTVP